MALTLEAINRWPASRKMIALGGVVLLMGAAYYFGVYETQAATVTALQDKLDQVEKNLSETRTLAADLPKFQAELQRLEGELKLALLKLPNEKNLEVLLKDISKVAKESGVEILSIEPQSEVLKEFYAEIPVQLKLTGGYTQMAIFFDKVSRLDRIVNISNLSVGSPKEEGDRIELSVSGLATTFRFVNVANEPGAAPDGKDGAKKSRTTRRRAARGAPEAQE